MTIGAKGMRTAKMISNFVDSLITQNSIKLSAKSDGYFDSPESLCVAFIEESKLSAAQEVPKRTNKILGTKCKRQIY